jgi:hypothetical protein
MRMLYTQHPKLVTADRLSGSYDVILLCQQRLTRRKSLLRGAPRVEVVQTHTTILVQ